MTTTDKLLATQLIKERPILFSAPMVRAILKGRKTQTRRVIKFPKHSYTPDTSWIKSVHEDGGGNWVAWSNDGPQHAAFTKKQYPNGEGFRCPYGKAGERLWVRENFYVLGWLRGKLIKPEPIHYAADIANSSEAEDYTLRPSIFMPRWASRILLGVTGVRVERLQDISEEDAEAEGVDFIPLAPAALTHRTAYAGLWNKINNKTPWASNPWVWVVEFKRLQP